jgi:cation:H+ antiporter
MELFSYALIFICSAFFLYIAGELIVNGLTRLSRFFGVTEFVLAFFVMALAASMPNLFVGITSAIQGIPELSFGDVMGNNMIALTLAVGIAVMFSPKKEIPANNQTVKHTTIFTLIAALLPILLIIDGTLSRIDGLILISFFIYYVVWLFSKKERFTKVYEEHQMNIAKESKFFFIDVVKVFGGVVILIAAAQTIVFSVSSIAILFNIPLVLIGIVILGLGSALPEVYFAISSARKNETGMILGNLMGAVIIPASLILGIVALIKPISDDHFDFFAISRLFLILAIIVFFVSTKTNEKITQRESFVLLSIYIFFVVTIILFS